MIFAPLARRPFRLLWAGQSVSTAGDALTQVASVFAVLRVGGTAADIGYVIAAGSGARVVFLLAGGVWADRLQRRLVMLAADTLRAAVQAVLAVLLLTGTARVWELAAGAAVYGAAQAFFGPAFTGVTPEVVPPGQVQAANGLMAFTGNLTQVAGPAAAGVLVAAFSPGVVFAADAASFVVSAACLAALRLPRRTLPGRSPLRADLAAGWHELGARPWYWMTLIAHASWNLAIPAFWVIGPVIALRSLGGPAAWGAISASWAAGAVAGAAAGGRARPRRPLVAANLAMALAAVTVLALIPPLPAWAVAAAAAAGGLGVVFLNVIWTSAIQQMIPDQVRSRVDSYDWLISLAVMPAGYALVGPLAARFGDPAVLGGAALLLGAPVLAATLIPGMRAVHWTAAGEIAGPPHGPAQQAVSAGGNP